MLAETRQGTLPIRMSVRRPTPTGAKWGRAGSSLFCGSYIYPLVTVRHRWLVARSLRAFFPPARFFFSSFSFFSLCSSSIFARLLFFTQLLSTYGFFICRCTHPTLYRTFARRCMYNYIFVPLDNHSF